VTHELNCFTLSICDKTLTYPESIKFLYHLQKFGMKFGLRGIQTLLASFDHPEQKFPSIHIAGTNGKGSTASMIASMFTAAGYKTGLYTSPHLVKFNERIRINGKPISSHATARLVSVIRKNVERNNCTFFEAVTAMAFLYFAESEVEIAIIETGLGGRLDATNVLHPLVSVITSIGMEHTQILGTKITKIAFEKGGIIKHGVPCLTGAQSHSAIQMLQKISHQKKSQFMQVHPQFVHIKHSSLSGSVADYRVAESLMKNVRISLAGEHQTMNACLALNAIAIAAKQGDFKISNNNMRKGLRNIQEYSGLQARLSIVRKNPIILADVAHNPDAIRTLVFAVQQFRLGKIHILFGIMQDKNYMQIIAELQRIAKDVLVVEAKTDRSRRSSELAGEFRRLGVRVSEFSDVKSGVTEALKKRDDIPILMTGSHFVVGEALAYLKREKYLTINQ
jgi:dihydrofolate synthase / folylpolyglutamate synthase